MTNPRLAVAINSKRWYRNPNRHDGQPVYAGVTDTCGALPKYGIPYWAANTVAEYAVSYMENWSGLPAMDAYEHLRKVPWRTRDRAAAKGTEVHAVVEHLIRGEGYGVEAEVLPWVEAAQLAVRELAPRPVMMEATCFNERHRFAGTCDFVGYLDAFPEFGLTIIDWKTGKDIYPDMGVQVVGGYALGADYIVDANDREIEWEIPKTALLCHLTAQGYQLHQVPMDPAFRRAFLAALEIRKWEKDGPKVGRPFRAPEGWNLVYLRQLIQGLDHDRALQVSTTCQELGIPTRPAQMTPQHIEQVIGLIKLLDMQDEQPNNIRALRPMP
jgi:hypothetical protein